MNTFSMFHPLPGSVVLRMPRNGTFKEVPLAKLGDAVFAQRSNKSNYLRLYKDGRTSSDTVFWHSLETPAPITYNAYGHMLAAG